MKNALRIIKKILISFFQILLQKNGRENSIKELKSNLASQYMVGKLVKLKGRKTE